MYSRRKKLAAFTAFAAGLVCLMHGTARTTFASPTPAPTPTPVANMPEDVYPVPTPTSTPSSTPTPTPTPTPPCPYFKGTLNYSGWDQWGTKANPFAGSDMTNACVQMWVSLLGSTCPSWDGYCDDKKSDAVANYVWPGKLTLTIPQSQLNAGDHSLINVTGVPGCSQAAFHHFDYGGGNFIQYHSNGTVTVKVTCIKGYAYFDSNCDIVDENTVHNACGDEPETKFKIDIIKSSPISLLWKRGADIETDAVASSFPLDPSRPGKWYAWRASDDTPLLVFDPAHSGRITQASQLFGNWTFGGKRVASLSERGPLPEPWKDGFEALATLDRDGDGRLTGVELRDLGLWFDSNRDSVSQPGEVRSLFELGVKTLFVTPDNRGSSAQHVYAARGFERAVEGKIVSGSSVDWFAESADTPGELMAGLALRSGAGKDLDIRVDTQQIVKDAYAKDAERRSNFGGLWVWSFDDPRAAAEVGSATQGVLVFDSRKDDEIRGYSMVLSPFEKTPKNVAAGRMTMLAVHGKRDGQNATFEPEAPARDARIKSEAILSDDGQTLTGKSTASYDSAAGLKRLSYSWTARRVR